MISRLKLAFFISFLLFTLSITAGSQSAFAQEPHKKEVSGKKRKSPAAKEKLRKEKEQQKAEEAARKKHMGIQTKETRRRMQRNQKLTAAKRENKKELFIVRWFSRK
jgi:LAS superfamily LD-carboxypeptidase LdcB